LNDNHFFLKNGIALFGIIGAFGMAHVVHVGQNELIRANNFTKGLLSLNNNYISYKGENMVK
jgi:hypothetical protein